MDVGDINTVGVDISIIIYADLYTRGKARLEIHSFYARFTSHHICIENVSLVGKRTVPYKGDVQRINLRNHQ